MTGPFYDVIDNNNEEMKTLRASPTSPASRSSDVEHGQRVRDINYKIYEDKYMNIRPSGIINSGKATDMHTITDLSDNN